MNIKNTLKKGLEITLVSFPLWGPIGTFAVTSAIENNKYNSLSREEKIEYLENKLNTTYEHPPAIAFVPRIGGGPLVCWGRAKKNLQEELKKLKSSDYKE